MHYLLDIAYFILNIVSRKTKEKILTNNLEKGGQENEPNKMESMERDGHFFEPL